MRNLKLKINRFLFKAYYDRVPEFFHKWTILKSLKLLVQNYEHSQSQVESLEVVIRNASKREIEMRTKISSLELRLKGIRQDALDKVNNIFGTDLKGISKQETDN